MSTARSLAKAELAILPDATLGAISYTFPDGRGCGSSGSSGVSYVEPERTGSYLPDLSLSNVSDKGWKAEGLLLARKWIMETLKILPV